MRLRGISLGLHVVANDAQTFKVLKDGGTDYNLLKTWCLLGFLRCFEGYFEVRGGWLWQQAINGHSVPQMLTSLLSLPNLVSIANVKVCLGPTRGCTVWGYLMAAEPILEFWVSLLSALLRYLASSPFLCCAE